jgi:Glucosamine 6-phosphate synthetase, contains amidotransferase and phosphosugar isomerase domains
MCGIVGAIAGRDVVPVLVEGLKRLEYRGYDSSGIAVLEPGTVRRVRRTGRVVEMEAVAAQKGVHGQLGIGHTRWATHGGVTEANAHPHISAGVALVHNGIIENHEQQRERLLGLGYTFESQTDTEVIAHLIHHHLHHGSADLLAALQAAVKELTGAYALAVMSADEPERLVVARMGCPLLVGLGEGENFVASDVSAILQATRRVIFLEEGDTAELDPQWRARVRCGQCAGTACPAPVRCVAGFAGTGAVPPLHAEGNPRAAARAGRHHRCGDQCRQF